MREGKLEFLENAINFDEHVSKSVPGYKEGHEIILSLSDYFLTKENSYSLDIGSSTGTLIKKLSDRHFNKKLNLIGIDPVNKMIEISKKNLANNFNHNIKFECSDFIDYEVKNEISIFISYYTMQFIHPSRRQLFINKSTTMHR